MKVTVKEHGTKYKGKPVNCPECEEVTGHIKESHPCESEPTLKQAPRRFRCKFCNCLFDVEV